MMIDRSYTIHPRDQVYTVAEIKLHQIESELNRISQVNLSAPPMLPETLMLLRCIRERYKEWQSREQVYTDFYSEIFKLLRLKPCRTGFKRLVELCPDLDGWHYAIDCLIQAAWLVHESD
jgi:hypothetical protein